MAVAAVLMATVAAAPAGAGESEPSPLAPDFDANGSTDVFWYGPGAGLDELWQWNGERFEVASVSVSGTYQRLLLDVDADGDTDVFWYAPGSRPDYLWRATPGGFVSSLHPVIGSYQPLVIDHDGDGTSEIFWYAPGPAPDYVWTWDGSSRFLSERYGVRGSYLPIVADVDGDSSEEIFWYAAGGAPDYLWSWESGAVTSRRLPVSGTYRPFTADGDGDGDAEIYWYAPGGGKDYRWDLTSGSVASVQVNVDGVYEPHVADFDADGVDEVLLYADGPGNDFLWHLDAGGPAGEFAAVAQAGSAATPIVGDFDGNGAADVIFHRPTETAVSWWRGGPGGFDVQELVVEGSGRAPDPNAPGEPFSSTHAVGSRTLTINAFLPVGSGAGVTLLHPVSIVERVGWHQGYAGNQPTEMTPAPTAIRDFVLPSRGRGTAPHTAADIPVDPISDVWAATTGTVARAGTYNLQSTIGVHPDVFVVIRPDSNPAKEVTMLHMVGLQVQPGDRVEAGVTTVANNSRKFPFASQVDAYTANPSWPHVHLEIRPYSGSSASTSEEASRGEFIPNTPTGTDETTLCFDEATGSIEPCDNGELGEQVDEDPGSSATS